MNIILTNFKKILNVRTLFSVLAITLLCFFSHTLNSDQTAPPTFLELTADALFKGKCNITRQEIISDFDLSYWFYTVLPVILSMPAVSDLYEEWFGGGFYLNVHRQQIFKYSVSKCAVYSVTAAASFLIGVGLFCAVISAVFPNAADARLEWEYPNGFFAYMLPRLLNAAAAAAICPLITVIILILIKEKFLALSIPMLANYMTAQLGNFLNIKAFTDDKPYLNKIAALLPYYQFRQSSGFEDTFGVPFFVWYTAWALSLILCVFVLFYLVKRRVKNGG